MILTDAAAASFLIDFLFTALVGLTKNSKKSRVLSSDLKRRTVDSHASIMFLGAISKAPVTQT